MYEGLVNAQENMALESNPGPGVPQLHAPVAFGPKSTKVTCPSCHHLISSTVQIEVGTQTHFMAALLCHIGCLLCCWIPYCKDTCKNRKHYCPACGAYLGLYKD